MTNGEVTDQRRLPELFVAGAPRCGTTFLSLAIAAHPDAFLCDLKEPHYFGAPAGGFAFEGPGDSYLNGTWIADVEEYHALYAGRTERVWVDGSTTLMFWPDAISDIHERIVAPTFVVALRDPVDRAVSAYTRLRAQGLEPAVTLTAAVDSELAGERDRWSPGFRYVEQGRYADPLLHLHELAGDRLHVVTFDEITNDLDAVVRRVWRAVGLDADVVVEAPTTTNATPWVSNPVLRYLFVRPLRVRSLVARAVPDRLVERLKSLRASRRAEPQVSADERAHLMDLFERDLDVLRSRLGIELGSHA